VRKDTEVARQAADQHGVLRRADARAHGLSASALHRRTEAGLLVPCHPNVVRAAGAPVTWRGELLAAVLSSGDAAVASHRSAAELWALDGVEEGVIELTLPLGYRPTRKGAIVHRAVVVDPTDRTVIDGIPVTRIDATLIATAAVVRADRLSDIVDSALVQGLTRADRVLARLDRLGRRGRRNAGRLALLLEQRIGGARPHESRFERRLCSLLERRGLPRPEVQFEVRVGGRLVGRADLAYPELRVAIEADGYRWHGGRGAWERDLARRTALAAAGWLVLHFSWRDLAQRPGSVIATVRAALDSRGLSI
jgi:very-short-patch-repair endonuclease